MKEVYGESNLCRICNIKQILTYAKMKVQPVWIDYYFIPETKTAWKYWLENKPVNEMTENNGPSARKEA